MKTLRFTHLIIALLLFCHTIVFAQKTHYVDNLHLLSTPFSSLQIAIDSAKTGDVIVIQGSPISYGNIKIANKALTFIGTGHHPKKQNAHSVLIDEVEFSPETKNVTFDGLVLNKVNTTQAEQIQNLTVRNCQINKSVELGDFTYNCLFYSNVFEKNATISSKKTANLVDVNFSNNFFYLPKIGPLGNVQNIRFSNNLFSGDEVGVRPYIFDGMKNVLIENNLFYHVLSFENVKNGNVLTNNYSSECDMAFDNHLLTSGFNPMFKAYKGGTFAPHYDFRNISNVGIYTGKYEFSMTGEAANVASVRTLNVQNQSLKNDTLRFMFNFEANAAKIFSQNPSLNFKINNYLEKFADVNWSAITEVEYFLDIDPGVGKATKLVLQTPFTKSLNLTDVAAVFSNVKTPNKKFTLFISI